MSDSADGLSVAATRQNAGRSANGLACTPPRPAGAVSPPAATDCASVIVVFGSDALERSSQVAASAGAAAQSRAAAVSATAVFIQVSSPTTPNSQTSFAFP